jgi:hypothetical protein
MRGKIRSAVRLPTNPKSAFFAFIANSEIELKFADANPTMARAAVFPSICVLAFGSSKCCVLSRRRTGTVDNHGPDHDRKSIPK